MGNDNYFKPTILRRIRIAVYNLSVMFVPWVYRTFYGMNIGEGTCISRKAWLDKNINPHGIHIGKYTRITGQVDIMTHDDCRRLKADVFIGDNCFLGTHSIILPGVHIGNECIVGAGAVVTKDVPSNCIVAGNPAKIIKTGIHCDKYGRLRDFKEHE